MARQRRLPNCLRDAASHLRQMPDKRQELLPKPDVEGGTEDAPDARDDLMNIALLLLLYTLQGVPMGLAGAIPCRLPMLTVFILLHPNPVAHSIDLPKVQRMSPR